MDFSIMFWGDSADAEAPVRYYENLVTVSQYADANGFSAIWLPERHFHPWGAMHPNPSVLAAALSMVTKTVKLRAGSVVLPLHNPIRVVEEWSVVDNLSNGRVELSIATGWREDDFALANENYTTRRSHMWAAVKMVEGLWRGEPQSFNRSGGGTVSMSTFPRAVQPEVPIWITSAGALRTMSDAGGNGYNLLTHMLHQDYDALEKKISQYKAYRTRGGFQGTGKVSVMLHTFLGKDRESVRESVKPTLSSYLLNSADLSSSGEVSNLSHVAKTELADLAFTRYFESASLMGTIEFCAPLVKRLADMGVTEICCLSDFGMPLDSVLESMKLLTELAQVCEAY